MKEDFSRKWPLNDVQLNSAITRLARNHRDEDAWEDLYKTLYPYLFASLFRKLRGYRFLAEDASQEVMGRLIRNMDFSQGSVTPPSLIEYLNRTIQSVVSDFFRREANKGRDEILFDDTQAPFISEESFEGLTLLILTLEKALTQLSEGDKNVISMIASGRNALEVAKELKSSEKTAYNRISLARSHLRQVLFKKEQ